jgi:DNA helicase IV
VKLTKVNTANLNQLNNTQKEAVTSVHKKLLVLAGAGSGKTHTLISRLNWLITEKNVKPYNILAITFTKDAANEMLDRLIETADDTGKFKEEINTKGLNSKDKYEIRKQYYKSYPWLNQITICTFHSLCYKLLKEKGVHQFDNRFKIITNSNSNYNSDFKNPCTETVFSVMQKVLINCCENPSFLLNLKRYIIDYYVDKIEVSYFSESKYYGRPFTTLHGEKVRSKSEQFIADWLYRHSIQYIYEPKINFVDFDFKPDFFIPEANLYIEHISNLSSPMQNKEMQFKKAGKRLVRTFEEMTKNSRDFSKELERIIKGNFSQNYNASFALNYEEEFSGYHQHIKDFARDVLQVLDKIKVEKVHSSLVFKNGAKSNHQRVRDFYLLAKVLIKEYHGYLINKSYLDFNDLSIQALKLLEIHQDVRESIQKRYKHILVDEFQDVNSLQVELLQQMVNKDTNIFCVGDDWQGIYGFRGSDVKYIIEFDKHFKGAETIKLNLNYRSNQTIVEASNELIRKNKLIVDKELIASNKKLSKLNIFAADEAGIDDVEYLVNRVKELQKQGVEHHNILILYRRSKMFEPYKRALEKEQLKVTAKTIHSAKGLEAEVVFIIGLFQGYGGFPDIWYNDAIYQVIRKEKFNLMLEEERRLFYVALTRAKEEINLITMRGNESQFIDEIPLRYFALPKVSIMSISRCPQCGKQLEAEVNYCSVCGEKLKT